MTTFEHAQLAKFDAATHEAWLRLVEKALKGADFEKRLVQRTSDGIRIEPLYARAQGTRRAATASSMGMADHSPDMPWEMRQLCIESDPSVANAIIRDEIGAGATGCAVRIAAPGQAGLPASAEGLSRALDGIDLGRTTVQLQAGESAGDAALALDDIWSAQNVPADHRRAAFDVDPLGTMARLGGLDSPLKRAVSDAAALAADRRWAAGRITVLCADGRPYHEAGGSEAQELAGCLATLVAYLRALETSGVAADAAWSRITVAFAADADLFLTLAKLRAARRLIGRVGSASGAGAASRISMVVTASERMMTRHDPWVNLLRTCAAGMAAAIAGADALTILPFTWALGRPDAFARRIARNMHVVLREESGFGRSADPASGSWYLDALTDDLARAGWSEFQAIEAAGGIEAALRSSYVQDRIAAVATERARSIATGRAALTGVSAFPKLGPEGVEVTAHDLPGTMAGDVDTLPPLSPIRLAQPFEALRDSADAARAGGLKPAIFLASLGTTADHSARSTWIANFMAAGGIETIANDGFTSSQDVGRSFAQSGAAIACICSSDQVYAELAEAVASVLKQAGARKVLLAGRPKAEAELRAAGVDAFVFAGQDAIATLSGLQSDLGVG